GAGGELAVDLPVVGGGELGYVTEVFNDMVARLRDSHHELERLSITDDLTGLYNRRYVMEALANEVRRSRRLEHLFTLLMLDVDHFKEYNDAYGHLAGDAALARVAAILKESTRDVDCAPGDEAQEDPAAAPALVRDPYPLIHVGIAGQPRARVHRKEHLVTAARPLAHVAVRRRLELHGHGERHFARAQRRPALVSQA